MKLCGFDAGLDQPFFLIAGPCVIESEQLAIDTAGQLKELTTALNIPFIYKSSFDKANRSSHESFRGLGIEVGLKILDNVKQQIGVPVLTDIHEDTPLEEVASVVDVMQTPAFVARDKSLYLFEFKNVISFLLAFVKDSKPCISNILSFLILFVKPITLIISAKGKGPFFSKKRLSDMLL